MAKIKGYAGIERALQKGLRLDVFRSGGGLRVVRLELKENYGLKGYGEHYHLSYALRMASQNFLKGRKMLKSKYLTGTSQTENPLDSLVCQGYNLSGKKDGGDIRLELKTSNNLAISITRPTFKEAYDAFNDIEKSKLNNLVEIL